MPIITTDKLGLNADVSNPKPVRHLDWCGNPMKEGDSYWGESKPQSQPPPPPQVASKPRVKKVKRSWTKEQIEAMRARMAIARAKRRPTNSVAAEQSTQGET
jgi:hypothetical protein